MRVRHNSSPDVTKNAGVATVARDPQQSLRDWTAQKWRTKSGRPSSETGERYLPESAIRSLSSREYAETTRAKREGKARGQQYVRQPKRIARKTAAHR